MKRLLQSAIAGALVSSLFLAVGASPAAAVVQLAACSGEYEASYNPGVNYEVQEIQSFTTSTYDCTLISVLEVTHTTATVVVGATITTSCLDLLEAPGSGQGSLTWGTGETTVYDWTATASQAGDTTVVTVIGTVVAGKFLGAKIVRASTFVQQTLESECGSPDGLTYVQGDATLTVTKLL